MSDPFIAEVRIVGFNFAPRGWAFCNGQLLPITQNTALFSLLGTNYGGNGTTTFALPNLQGRSPMHAGQGPGLSERTLGESGGSAAVTLVASQVPAHTHALQASATASTGTPSGTVALASNAGASIYRSPTGQVAMADAALAPAGSGLPHNNRQPYLAMSFIIALQGIFPPRP
jgi:microcystin-dependent protein